MPDEQIAALLEHGEQEGCLNLSEFSEFAQAHELDEEQLTNLYEELEARQIDLTDEPGFGWRIDRPAIDWYLKQKWS